MASIRCTNKGVEHTHTSVLESKICYGLVHSPVPPSPPASTVIRTIDGATARQISYVGDLGGDADYAAGLTRAACSAYIDKLKRSKMSTPVTTTASRVELTEQQKFIVQLLPSIPEGYFAVSPTESDSDVTFLRITKPTKGRFAGTIKVQTQHSEVLDNAFVVYSSGRIWVRQNIKDTIEDTIKFLFADYPGAAMRYARLIGKCCRCNLALTDAKSRWYGIGPVCDQQWPWIIDYVEERKGAFRESW